MNSENEIGKNYNSTSKGRLTFVKYPKDSRFAFSFVTSKAIFVAESELIRFLFRFFKRTFEYHKSHRFHPSFATLAAGSFVAHALFFYLVWSYCSCATNPGCTNYRGTMAGGQSFRKAWF